MLEMAAKLHISSSFSHKANDSPTSSSSSYSSFLALPQFLCTPFSSGFAQFKLHAKLGGGDGEVKPKEKKKFITKEEEPEQYWQSAGEREGENPMKTPLPYIIIFDAAWKKENNMAAFGCIFTNSQGRIHYQTTQAERNVPSPRVAEALALRWVLIAALLQGFSRICFNTDCQSLLAALNSKAPPADLHGIIQDINHLVMTQPQLQRPKNLSCLRSSPELPHPRNVPASPQPITAQAIDTNRAAIGARTSPHAPPEDRSSCARETHAPPAAPASRRQSAAAASPVTFLIWSPFEQLEFIVTTSYCC